MRLLLSVSCGSFRLSNRLRLSIVSVLLQKTQVRHLNLNQKVASDFRIGIPCLCPSSSSLNKFLPSLSVPLELSEPKPKAKPNLTFNSDPADPDPAVPHPQESSVIITWILEQQLQQYSTSASPVLFASSSEPVLSTPSSQEKNPKQKSVCVNQNQSTSTSQPILQYFFLLVQLPTLPRTLVPLQSSSSHQCQPLLHTPQHHHHHHQSIRDLQGKTEIKEIISRSQVRKHGYPNPKLNRRFLHHFWNFKDFRRNLCVLQFQWNFQKQNQSVNMSGDSGKKSVAIVGSGNWGSAIAKIVGANTVKYSDVFEEEVRIYVYEELVDGRKLTEIINEDHENVKYLPGHKLPTNVVAIPDVVEAAGNADIIIFVLPHQFIKNTCQPLVGKMKPGAFGLSLIKGFDIAEGGGIDLISHIITRFLSIPCSVLMGANLANEIANEKFSETTIGTHDVEQGQILHKLIQTDFFRVVVVADVETVEICGALKNIVAVGAGFVDGLEYGDNTKAAVIRLGLMEMIRFAQEFYGSNKLSTFLESCGVADLITTCYGGRNRKVSEAFVRTGKTLAVLEQEMLNGQRLQGPMTASEVHHMLEARGLLDKFPLFTAVHRICVGELEPKDLIDSIRNHPEHTSSSMSKSSL